MGENNEKTLLPHHEQQSLCTTRLPYRQGRKLTAIKVYTVASESNHLLAFGVPSLNLRQETKALFMKFGKVLQLNISKEHTVEAFTETFHIHYERIQSARIAKKMLDTKNFYGGSLHVCYAPEFENINETRQKLVQRQKDITNRLKNITDEPVVMESTNLPSISNVTTTSSMNSSKTLNMGEVNTFKIDNNTVVVKKRNLDKISKSSKKVKHSTEINNTNYNANLLANSGYNANMGPNAKSYNANLRSNSSYNANIEGNSKSYNANLQTNSNYNANLEANSRSYNANIESNAKIYTANIEMNANLGSNASSSDANLQANSSYYGNIGSNAISYKSKELSNNIEIIDCTSVDKDTVSNINEALNYNRFGNEIVRSVPKKPLNKIVFNVNKHL